ncbi:MAG: hypothetical protein JNL66_22975 [Alphaproteobacteria bacterium]|nr:hypothetical protein [Alphaproteobacteria bacterium]
MEHDKTAGPKPPHCADDATAKRGTVEGEGSYSAARAYQKGAHEFAKKSGAVDAAAQDAAKAVEGPERAALERAEQAGKAHAKGEDPALRGTTRG